MDIEDKRAGILQFLREKIAKLTNNPEILHHTDDFVQMKHLGMDSVRTINMIIDIENHYDIIFEDEELDIEFISSIHVLASKVLDKLSVQA